MSKIVKMPLLFVYVNIEMPWFNTLHRGAFYQSSFRLIYYYGSNKSTGKETVKSHICALFWNLEIFGKRMKINQALHMDEMNMPKN